MTNTSTTALRVASLSDLPENAPFPVNVEGADVVLVRRGDHVSALSGRCGHRGALLADGHVEGSDLVCTVHGWNYDLDSGVAPANPAVTLTMFPAWVVADSVHVDDAAIAAY